MLVLTLVVLAAAFAAFALFLAFCAFIVIRTGGTAGLRDFAVAVRAFGSVWSLRGRGR